MEELVMTENGLTPADLAAVTGNNNGFGGDGSYWIIILFLFAFMGWGGGGFGGNGGGATDNYVLASDFATLQRQLSDGFGIQERRTDSIINGICDTSYTNAQLINGLNNSLNTQGYETRNAINGVSSQLASCCCDIREGISNVNYNMAMNNNATQRVIENGFCTQGFNMNNNTRDIIDSQNAGTRAILEAINEQKLAQKDEKIQEQAMKINALQLAASQANQNAYLLNELKPCPVPAYITCNPYTASYGLNNGCGCN